MSICVFTKSLLKGGAEKQSVILATILAQYYQTYLIVLHDFGINNYEEYLNGSAAKVVLLRGNIFRKIYFMINILKSEKIKILFCFLFSTNVIGTVTGKIAGVKYIIGGIRNSYHPLWKELIMKYMHNHLTDYTILNNYSAQKVLEKKKFNLRKMVVIPNGIKLNEQIYFRLRNGAVTIITVARFVQQKDYRTAINAIEYLVKYSLNKNYPRIFYKIVGYGQLKNELQRYIDMKRLGNVISICDDSNMEEIYYNADIYLCTSTYEGTSNSIMEAMNYALPIVATDVGDNIKLVRDLKNGFICHVGDYKRIAACLDVLIIHHELRTIMGRHGQQFLRDNYSLQIFGKKYLMFINSLQPTQHNHVMKLNVFDPNLIKFN